MVKQGGCTYLPIIQCRVGTYAILGVLFGSLGWGLKLAGLQQSISLVTGGIILVMMTYQLLHLPLPKMVQRWHNWLINTFGKLFKSQRWYTLYLMGALNGLLPCGFVYIGLAGSVAASGWWQGGLYMALFGAGTLPLLMLLTYSKNLVKGSVRSRLNRLTPVFAVLIAVLFILRGLNLGIPYVSPQTHQEQPGMECCKKR